ncbi:MAG: fibronectin type III domain-containing protein [Bacteroidetes bacterium]|nr:fibronectin type III domain-containing protein [Bacteroidota bacterium]
MRTDCGGSGFSIWSSSAATFNTPCNVFSLPWSEGFESMATVGTNLYPSCWSYSNVTSSNYSCNGTCNSNTAHAGTKFIGGSWSFNVWYFTPSFNLTAGTSYDFSYWVKTTDAVVGYNLSTFYGTSQTIGAMTNSIGTPVTGYNVATWTKVTATFTPATSGTYYFGLNNNCPTSAPNGIGFDDFALDVTPSCVPPTLPTGTATGTTTANISWTAASPTPSNGYQYAVTTSVTPPGSGTAFAGTSTSVSGLSANTTYYVHVRSDCGGTFSPWATSAATFTTPCNAITSLISESFNTMGSIPPCWSTAIQNGTVNWTFASADGDAQFTPHSGAAMAVKLDKRC